MPQIPSLKSIQAFEVVVRRLSFKDAAEELHVTPTAISHQIKNLEEHFGMALFHRLPRSLHLTKEGEIYAPFIREAFEKLNAGSAALLNDDLDGTLTITTTNSFASNWLVPRLKRFSEQNPLIAVKVLGSDELLTFPKDNIDLAIRYGESDHVDLHAAWILDDFVSAVCAPDYLPTSPEPSMLQKGQLIQYEWTGFSDKDPSWEGWFQNQGFGFAPQKPVNTFSEEHMCISAARDGHGVALVSLIAAARDLEEERLVAPFDYSVKNKSYYLVCPKSSANRAKVQVFQDWLLDEADLFRDSVIGQRFFEK